MSKLIIFSLLASVVTGMACKKEKDRGCGCDTKQISEQFALVNGSLVYSPDDKTWGLVIPAGVNTNVRFSGQICNVSQAEVRKFTDTAGPARPAIPIRVSCEIRRYCPDNSPIANPADVIPSLFTVSKMERR